jgi:hypothetical protein
MQHAAFIVQFSSTHTNNHYTQGLTRLRSAALTSHIPACPCRLLGGAVGCGCGCCCDCMACCAYACNSIKHPTVECFSRREEAKAAITAVASHQCQNCRLGIAACCCCGVLSWQPQHGIGSGSSPVQLHCERTRLLSSHMDIHCVRACSMQPSSVLRSAAAPAPAHTTTIPRA